jgi:hypothetical protein
MHDIVLEFARVSLSGDATDGAMPRGAMQQAVVASFFENRPEAGWQLTTDASVSERRVSRYVFSAISHHCREALEATASSGAISLDSGVGKTAVEWLTSSTNPTAMLTDIVAREISRCLGAPALLLLAERAESKEDYMQSAQLYACASLAGWDHDYLPITVAKHFFHAAHILEAHVSETDIDARTLECSLRLLGGLNVMHEAEFEEICSQNLGRMRGLQAMVVGNVVKPEGARLATFYSAANAGSGDRLSTNIAALERQLASTQGNGTYEYDPGAHVQCECGAVELRMMVGKPRARAECCCCDCNGGMYIDCPRWIVSICLD